MDQRIMRKKSSLIVCILFVFFCAIPADAGGLLTSSKKFSPSTLIAVGGINVCKRSLDGLGLPLYKPVFCFRGPSKQKVF